ncbi:MAG: HEPN domain-containing protein [Gammaproteobacteria bacterium]
MIISFRNSLADSGNLRALYTHCVDELKLPGDYSDLLRMGFIYCLSALDKLIHDIIVHEMVEIYAGRRAPTPKYLADVITLDNHLVLRGASIPPPEIVFEGIVRIKLGHQSFMDPKRIVDALGLIWLENYKWQTIATEMGRDQEHVTTELRNLFQRRNAIVHEADKDPSSNLKLTIHPTDAERSEQFIHELGETIFRLILR